MKCLLISRFNVANIGDLAISQKLFEITSEYFTVDKYNLFGDPYRFTDINYIEKNNYSIKYKLFDFLNNGSFKWTLSLYKKIKNYISSKKYKSNLNFENIVGSYDLIIIGGGNMLMELSTTSKSIDRFKRYVSLAKKNNKPIFIMDIGIGPFKTEKQVRQAVKILNECDFITFRDNDSYNIFINNDGHKEKAFISVDPVFLLNNNNFNDEKVVQISEKHIGINIINSKLIGDNNEEYYNTISSYANLINDLIRSDNICISIFISTKEDQPALDDVYKLIKNKNRVNKVSINGLKDLTELYTKLDLLIGTRMHSMIIAYTMKVPLIGLSWQKKVDSFFEIIQEERYIYKLKYLNIDKEKVIDSCKMRIKNAEHDKDFMELKLKDIRKNSRVNLDILENYSKT